ncbi:MAG: DHA2 family efflux MFS transporter permease subunit [Acidimicrobiales bacterium]
MHADAIDASLDPGIDDRIHARRWFTLATLCLSLLIIVMDNTILNVAIPKLIDELGATNSQLQWIVDGYTLVFAGLLLTTGSLGDRFGRKLALRVGIVIFALGSVLSALAGSAVQLIATRSLMGVGGALIMPSTLSILTNVFRDPRERGRAIAIWAGFSGLGVAIGPVTGGLLLEHFSWSSVFWVNLPIGTLALIAGFFFVPETKDPTAPRLDPLGALLSIVGLGSVLFAIIEGPSKGWTSTEVLIGAFVGLVGVAAFVAWELHTDHPMLDLRFFENPRFTAANIAVTLTFFAMFGSLFLMTQYWQLVHGFTPLQAGVHLIPYALTMMFTAPMSARLVEKLGTKRVVTMGLLLISAAMLALSTIQPDSSYLRVIVNMCFMSVGMGLTMAPATESVMGSLPREKAGVGSAVNDTTRQMGGALGVAVIGSLVASVYAAGIDDAAPANGVAGAALAEARGSLGGAIKVANGLGDAGAGFLADARQAFVDGLSQGLRVGAAVVFVAAMVAFRFLPARAPGHREVVAERAGGFERDPDVTDSTVPVAGS